MNILLIVLLLLVIVYYFTLSTEEKFTNTSMPIQCDFIPDNTYLTYQSCFDDCLLNEDYTGFDTKCNKVKCNSICDCETTKYREKLSYCSSQSDENLKPSRIDNIDIDIYYTDDKDEPLIKCIWQRPFCRTEIDSYIIEVINVENPTIKGLIRPEVSNRDLSYYIRGIGLGTYKIILYAINQYGASDASIPKIFNIPDKKRTTTNPSSSSISSTTASNSLLNRISYINDIINKKKAIKINEIQNKYSRNTV